MARLFVQFVLNFNYVNLLNNNNIKNVPDRLTILPDT